MPIAAFASRLADAPWQAKESAPMRRDGNEDKLRYVLVTAFLLALVAILIVVALFVHQA